MPSAAEICKMIKDQQVWAREMEEQLVQAEAAEEAARVVEEVRRRAEAQAILDVVEEAE